VVAAGEEPGRGRGEGPGRSPRTTPECPIVAATARVNFVHRQVVMSRNITGGAAVDFFMGGLNRQIEHHLFRRCPARTCACAYSHVRGFCARHGIVYTETALPSCYRQIVTYLNRVGLNVRDPFTCLLPHPLPRPTRPQQRSADGDRRQERAAPSGSHLVEEATYPACATSPRTSHSHFGVVTGNGVTRPDRAGAGGSVVRGPRWGSCWAWPVRTSAGTALGGRPSWRRRAVTSRPVSTPTRM